MKFSVLILTIGIPGSGKTTWVKEYSKSHPLSIIISTDQIRMDLFGTMQCDPNQSEQVHDEARNRVKKILDDPSFYTGNYPIGPTIVVDSTNCDIQEWLKYKNLGSSVMLAKVFDVPPDEAENRQRNRERYVPRFVLEDKWKLYQKNKEYIPLIFNMIL